MYGRSKNIKQLDCNKKIKTTNKFLMIIIIHSYLIKTNICWYNTINNSVIIVTLKTPLETFVIAGSPSSQYKYLAKYYHLLYGAAYNKSNNNYEKV